MSILGEELLQILGSVTVGGRFILGIVGGPASGKSTLALNLCQEINKHHADEPAVVVPMDGFHYSNEHLIEIGLLPLKGIPATFDAEGVVALVERIHETKNESLFCPRFDRSIEASIPNDIEVKPTHRLVIVEGNYLLLEKKPWHRIANCLDQSWFIDCPPDVVMERLLKRHIDGGKTREEAKIKVESTDLPNAKIVAATRVRATRIIEFMQ